MHGAARHMKTAIKGALSKDAHCYPNPHCTGVICSWSDGGLLEVDLHHCQHPVAYHVLLKYPAFHISKTSLNLTQGDEKTLFKHELATVKIKVTKLERKENVVTTTVSLEACIRFMGCKLHNIMENQKFCVMMQNCPGYNESAHRYAPCNAKPPSHSAPKSSPRASNSKGLLAFALHPDSFCTQNHGTHNPQKGGDGDNNKGRLSTAAIIGICAAAAFAILIVVGVVVYWKKYHHRSRLRAAYYNDISMHDPLYEDFGPEVA
ncbi:unnamed protein product [Porites evermanni]|uniref:Uncharacterized protein n=1 Tax=Porites evermanni TaxID=104178 RepID=A0ABN8RBL7_9CNID|nr:unnamed protein product [Porites evermanni]